MIFLFLLLGYLLFRFIVGFVVPVFRTTRKVREQFSQMNRDRARQQGFQPGPKANEPGSATAGNGHRAPDASKVGEYIDFEEVKP